MLKLFILLSIFLGFASCRAVESEENVCLVEADRWAKCEKEFQEKTMESSIDYMKDQKKMLDCIGDLKCKGYRKLLKFQYDASNFANSLSPHRESCVFASGQTEAVSKCISPEPPLSVYSVSPRRKPKIQCLEEAVKKTNCSKEEKIAFVGFFAITKDLTRQMGFASVDEEYLENFDLTFDPKKYGFQ